MLDLEDSTANGWSTIRKGSKIFWKRSPTDSPTLTASATKRWASIPAPRSFFTRPRGLHIHQAGVLPGNCSPASLFDVAMVAYQVDFSALKHPLCIYIPKSESADEALWWRDLFQMIARLKGLPTNAIKCIGAGRIASACFSDGRVCLESSRSHRGPESGPLGLMASLIHFISKSRVGTFPIATPFRTMSPFFQIQAHDVIAKIPGKLFHLKSKRMRFDQRHALDGICWQALEAGNHLEKIAPPERLIGGFGLGNVNAERMLQRAEVHLISHHRDVEERSRSNSPGRTPA